MSMKFDFRTKLLVIVLTMSLVAVLTSDILIYTLFGVLSVYLIIQGFGRQTINTTNMTAQKIPMIAASLTVYLLPVYFSFSIWKSSFVR